MKELAEFIITKIVNHPEEVVITEENEDGRLNLKISVNQEDLPIVIGKEGRIIKSIRNLIKASARKKNLWVNIELIEQDKKIPATPEEQIVIND